MDPRMMGPGGPMDPRMMGPMGPGGGPGAMQAQLEWQKLQQQYFHEKGKKGGMMMGPGGPMMMGPGGPMGPMGPRGPMMGGPGGRMPGPPPPYPQPGPRGPPPGAMASPNHPGSPATSLPMSSPAGGMMNSPRPIGSNPGTPVSGAPLTSPVAGSKNSPGSQASNQGGPQGKFHCQKIMCAPSNLWDIRFFSVSERE